MHIHRLTRLLAALLLLVGGLAITLPARAQGETVVVEAADGNVFEPATITINVGDTVTWRNTDDVPHTSTSEDEVWDSGALGEGEEFSFTFEEVGTYGYFCEFHPGMEGTVVVQEAAQQEEPAQEEEPTAVAEPTAEQEPAATEVPEDTTEGDQQGGSGDDQQGDGQQGGSGDDQQGDDQQGDDQQGEMPDHTPETGAGGIAGGGVPIAGILATFSLLFAGAYGLVRRQR
ncbi:MAG: cupredoxin family copper-binding protein [Chloroflexota bacterium]|nr:cupredoxin family copper-binding protein [Chloroflexota bacterium]